MTLHILVRELATPTRTLVRGLELRLPPGQIHTLMGASGSGKSCLLAAVCGTLATDLRFDGVVELDGQRVDGLAAERRNIGLLYQDGLLFPHLSVRENLLFALPPGRRPEREAEVQAGLRELGMLEQVDADPATLSGGQRMRVALMRALLARPRALMLDEPFSRLDAELRARMRALVLETVRRRAIPALLVTHDAEDVTDPGRLTRLVPEPPVHAGP